MTTQSGVTLLINGFGVLFVILNSFGLGLRLPIGRLLGQVAAHWKIAVWALAINFVVIPVVFIGYLLTIASSIPGRDQGRVLCRGPVCGYAFRSRSRPIGQGGCQHLHHPARGPDGGDHHRPAARVAPCHRRGRRATEDHGMGRCVAAAALHPPADGSRVRLQDLVARPDIVDWRGGRSALRSSACSSI